MTISPVDAEQEAERIISVPLEAEQPQPKRRGRKPGVKNRPKQGGVDAEQQAQLHAMVCVGIGALSIFMEEVYRPTQQEIDAIFQPLERLLMRRVNVSGALTPDVYDSVACVMGIVLYVSRVTATQAARGIGRGNRSRNVPSNRPNNAQENGVGAIDPSSLFDGSPENVLRNVHNATVSDSTPRISTDS